MKLKIIWAILFLIFVSVSFAEENQRVNGTVSCTTAMGAAQTCAMGNDWDNNTLATSNGFNSGATISVMFSSAKYIGNITIIHSSYATSYNFMNVTIRNG